MKVSVKDINVRYKGRTYEKGEALTISDKHFDENLFVKAEAAEEEDKNYLEFTPEELGKETNDDLKAFLDKEEVEYSKSATKAQLIEAITGVPSE